ncbi:MAG: substrate-binding domain-containing protein [Victivallales bacterium]|nr:substrate-binding domain-containing protein [Victivallales bacterium]
MFNKGMFSALLVLCSLMLGGCGGDEQSLGGDGVVRIAVIPKGTTHVFWKSVEQGALDAGRELDVNVVWQGPLHENDRAQQIAIVEQFVSEGIEGIVLAPLDNNALCRPVHSAMSRKIPVVIFDSPLVGEVGKDFTSFVATDNMQGGRIAGEKLAELLGGKGKVVLLRYMEGSASTMEREAGFLEVIRNYDGIDVIVDNRYGGATAGEAQTASLDLLDRLRESDGIFCPNESTSFGMLLALRQSNLAGKRFFVGFDASPPLLDGLKAGHINALVVQNPYRMGYEGVKTLVRHLRGDDIPLEIDTGVNLVTGENIDTPEIKEFLGL